MGVRRQTVEHPFGTLKAWMGATHFLTRTLDKVRTEMSLHVLAYNLKRKSEGFAMGSSEWFELETLNDEITHSQSRLGAARKAKNHERVEVLQLAGTRLGRIRRTAGRRASTSLDRNR
jgi:hypothetical protein